MANAHACVHEREEHIPLSITALTVCMISFSSSLCSSAVGKHRREGEVCEIAALSTHPAVLEAAVVGIPDERLGERVVAVLVPSSSPFSSLLADCSPPLSRAAGEAVLAACRPRLAG
mmetsp:Transcript_36858/g.85405  ORF Transcript_36858/g.85405 Transcript_36858/m.85405 type:complete len:117 (+) Transcript_36858:799-1149(+)